MKQLRRFHDRIKYMRPDRYYMMLAEYNAATAATAAVMYVASGSHTAFYCGMVAIGLSIICLYTSAHLHRRINNAEDQRNGQRHTRNT